MKSITAPHDTYAPYRVIDAIEQEKLDAGYEFLGWNNMDAEPWKECLAKGHNDQRTEPHWQYQQHNPRGSNVTFWCDDCKLLWKIDMSD